MSWTEEKVKKLKELWSKGHTASQIAEALGDTTRNAVIGKAHRLNLEARAPSKQSSTIINICKIDLYVEALHLFLEKLNFNQFY